MENKTIDVWVANGDNPLVYVINLLKACIKNPNCKKFKRMPSKIP